MVSWTQPEAISFNPVEVLWLSFFVFLFWNSLGNTRAQMRCLRFPFFCSDIYFFLFHFLGFTFTKNKIKNLGACFHILLIIISKTAFLCSLTFLMRLWKLLVGIAWNIFACQKNCYWWCCTVVFFFSFSF